MNIGIIVDNEYTNDIRVRNECKIFSDNGHKVHVLCFNFGNYSKNQEIIDGVFIQRLIIKRRIKNILFALTNTLDIYSYWWSKKIRDFTKEKSIDYLHVHDLYMSKAARIATKKSTTKIVLDLHENYPYAVDNYQWMHKPLYKYIIRPGDWKKKEKKYLSYANKLVVLSEEFRDYLIDKYDFLQRSQFVVYPNVPDTLTLTSFKIKKEILDKSDKYILFYFGAVSKRRGIDLLLKSIPRLSIEIPNILLLLIGPVDKAEQNWFNKELKKSQLERFIIYYPWKDISLLPSYINASDICLSPLQKNPQHDSGIANKVYQYMLFEKPIIVSNCLPQETLVKKHKCGLCFKWNSVDDFIKQVLFLYNNEESSINMGKSGKHAILNYLNANVLQQKLLKLYN
jgi:glycosyltransferase involved in cell wall biosynthesis